MQYEEIIELLGDYCENNIPIAINSFVNTVMQIIPENDTLYGDKETRLENMKYKIENKQFTLYSCKSRDGNRMNIRGICINTKDGIKNNSIVVTPTDLNNIKIVLISEGMYSGYTIYENKEEMNLSNAARI